MSEKNSAENFLENVMETVADAVSKQKSVSFAQEESSTASSGFSKLFGSKKPVHHVLGGGKSADVLLWRNKKISAGVLGAATLIWVLFEWLNYHFLTLLCFVLVLAMSAQFVLTHASGLLNRSPSSVPRVAIPEEVFANIGREIGVQVNGALQFLQNVACRGNLKQFLMVVASLWVAAIIGSWFNFITVIYVGFIAAHTLPVLYEKYQDQIDDFAYQVLGQLKHNYSKLDAGILQKIPKGSFKGKKHE